MSGDGGDDERENSSERADRTGPERPSDRADGDQSRDDGTERADSSRPPAEDDSSAGRSDSSSPARASGDGGDRDGVGSGGDSVASGGSGGGDVGNASGDSDGGVGMSEGQSTLASQTVRERDRPPQRRARPDDDRVTIEDDGPIRWFLRTNNGTVVAVRDVLSSVALVAVIGLVLFGVSGIWPPLVAVESGSMEPNMERGDMIFVVAEDRFAGDDPVDGTGIVTRESGLENGHEKFGGAGDVIIFRPNGNAGETPVIHRAHFWVEADENWVDGQADPEFVNGASCERVRACPAPHAGFVTKGDANSGYDQTANVGADTSVVKPEWTTGKGMFRIPWLGHVRLGFEELFAFAVTPGVSSTLSLLSPTLLGMFGAIGFAYPPRSRRR
ncbi:S26 family signal peptidase [Natronosalvus halobius]|uniref:S26 family signal peptidase n=1 Tax=Natronosalvus halobius TaxID=2953746 RepID=UPI0020A1D8F9|nr:S26 family signal peptidase [Natronosalvus halobius]USZ71108.1 S26 family signal peptidase [Natronosalvus halobius]